MAAAAEGMDRATADYAGMLATLLNALALQDALDTQAGAGFLAPADRGLGLFDESGCDGTCVLSVKDVARVAAKAAKAWF